MLFIVKEINENHDLLPGIKLGVIAYDTCDSPAYALEQSLDFIKGLYILCVITLKNVVYFKASSNKSW